MLSQTLAGRPRVLNAFHALGLASPYTQTVESELACLAKHASGRRIALEIGSFQGVSASVIARSLALGGRLYCVDPWEPIGTNENAVFTIAKRHFRRSGVMDRITIVQGFSHEVAERVPASLDFAFIDGDHSYDGLATDWSITSPRIPSGGIVCLHDTSVPESSPWGAHESARYFEDVIRRDARFRVIESVHSLNVLERIES
jgi:predicted O-methyltransferase YrrM